MGDDRESGRSGGRREGLDPIPTLTIGLPVFNGARYLEASVDSILSQSFSDLELIISDNASTDDTEAISRSIVDRDPRVTYRRNAANVGIAANFNLLVPLARGRLFKWATADDLLRPGFWSGVSRILDVRPIGRPRVHKDRVRGRGWRSFGSHGSGLAPGIG